MNNTITLRPHAKINIGLYVTGKRPDGYHNLETVFYPVPLCDELTITLSDTDSLQLEGIALEGDLMDNLVMRAVGKLRQCGHEVPPVSIRLRKNIPSGAGLGGGSSDAAFTVRGLNELLRLGLNTEEMQRMVASLGADCAFFITDQPMFATGIGDELSPISVNLSGMYIVMVKPDDFISTREAYSGVMPQQPQYDLRQSIAQDITLWPRLIENDFEHSIFPMHPAIADIKAQMYAQGAIYAAMSGSGSTVYGLFRYPASINIPYFQFCAKL